MAWGEASPASGTLPSWGSGLWITWGDSRPGFSQLRSDLILRMEQVDAIADPYLGFLAGETRPRLLVTIGYLGQRTTLLSQLVCGGYPQGKPVGTSAGRALAYSRCSINEHGTG